MKAAPLVILPLALMSASVAAGQSPNPVPPPTPPLPGYGDVRIPQTEENLDSKAVREAMAKFARCIARRRPKEAADFVLSVSPDTWNSLSSRIDESCALEAVDNPGSEVRVSTNSQDLLFALAEVLAQKLLDKSSPEGVSAAVVPAPTDPIAAVGECAVRANASTARNVLKSRLNSNQERAALQEMAPAFAGCIPKGMQVRFNPTSMRGAVAVGYYRLATHVQPMAGERTQ